MPREGSETESVFASATGLNSRRLRCVDFSRSALFT